MGAFSVDKLLLFDFSPQFFSIFLVSEKHALYLWIFNFFRLRNSIFCSCIVCNSCNLQLLLLSWRFVSIVAFPPVLLSAATFWCEFNCIFFVESIAYGVCFLLNWIKRTFSQYTQGNSVKKMNKSQKAKRAHFVLPCHLHLVAIFDIFHGLPATFEITSYTKMLLTIAIR